MNKIPCLVVCPGDDDRDAKFCLLTRQVFPCYEDAQMYLDRELVGFPNGRAKGAFIVECYFGTNLRPADPSKYLPVQEEGSMSKRYTQISCEEFEEFLGVGDNGKPAPNAEWNKNWKFHHIELQGVYENVYGMVVAPNVTLRIYSTIERGVSRDNGTDAIRCVLFWRSPEGEIKLIGMEKKVLRIASWRENLRKRIEGWSELMGPDCPTCNSPMARRKNRSTKSEFFGCVQYPVCKGTRKIDNE